MEIQDLSFLKKPLAQYIDHTLLKSTASVEQVKQVLKEAVEYNFASVCIPPYMAISAKAALKESNSSVKVCTVVGFPHGNLPTPLKVQEVQYFASRGIDEIDFVINVGLIKSELLDNFQAELKALDTLCAEYNTVSKCIIETCYLTEDEKSFMYLALSEHSNIDYIKTSTGYGTDGAQVSDVMKWNAKRQEQIAKTGGDLLILHEVPIERDKPAIKIKAAGGIRDLDTALKFIACGADRLGMSASVRVMEEYHERYPNTFTEGEETT